MEIFYRVRDRHIAFEKPCFSSFGFYLYSQILLGWACTMRPPWLKTVFIWYNGWMKNTHISIRKNLKINKYPRGVTAEKKKIRKARFSFFFYLSSRFPSEETREEFFENRFHQIFTGCWVRVSKVTVRCFFKWIFKKFSKSHMRKTRDDDNCPRISKPIKKFSPRH